MSAKRGRGAGSLPGADASAGGGGDPFARRQLAFGFSALLVYLSAGLGLDLLHGFKVQAYLSAANQMRRLMWTLGHAHGTLLSLVVIAFAVSCRHLPEEREAVRRIASLCLRAATVVLPAGFFLGGIVIHDGDPGVGALLVPVGGVLLMAGVGVTAWSFLRARPRAEPGARRADDERDPSETRR